MQRCREGLPRRLAPSWPCAHVLTPSSMASPTPPFDPSGTRYDQTTYAGRLAHFREMVSPATLLVSDIELQEKIDLLLCLREIILT